jgi:hypothetical protein
MCDRNKEPPPPQTGGQANIPYTTSARLKLLNKCFGLMEFNRTTKRPRCELSKKGCRPKGDYAKREAKGHPRRDYI